MGLLQKIFGTHSENELKRIYPIADYIESLEPKMQELSDEELRGKTQEFKERLANGETLDDILPEAYAAVREASVRAIGLRHFRVQLIGGIILHQGRISEMRTGEGKTLVSTLPAYLNALEGKGVHIVTVNDYLAQRDSEWMGRIHEFLGLTVGVVLNSMDNDERRKAYNCDIIMASERNTSLAQCRIGNKSELFPGIAGSPPCQGADPADVNQKRVTGAFLACWATKASLQHTFSQDLLPV